MMSPQGVFPGSKTVIVMGIHHPDACIELGGERHPQEIGPYSIQYLMNSRLDELSYRMATFIEKKGYGAIPICSSNIWRYNKYKDLDAIFAPDVSNIYMPVVAGLADMGYSGLALTPEYGARNRFVTIITDAEIEADPLIEPGTLCDKCMLCRKHCPSQALSKEIIGEKVLKIEGREYRFADKNLWRCAWGEHFDLDLDLEIPEKVTEQIILENVAKHGVRSGEMGQCLKFCVPKKIRSFDKAYSKSPMRRYCVEWNEDLESRAVADKLICDCYAKGIEHVVVQSADSLKDRGINIDNMLPGAVSAVSLLCELPQTPDNKRESYTANAYSSATKYHIDSVCYDLTRDLEALGFRSLVTISASGSHCDSMGTASINAMINKELLGSANGKWSVNTVFTRKQLPERQLVLKTEKERLPLERSSKEDFTAYLKDFALETGADLFGVSSAGRIDKISEQLIPHFDGQKYLQAKDNAHRFKPWEPEITEKEMKVFLSRDYMPDAKSVIVIGLRFHKKTVEFATKPPAEAVGPYVFQTYITRWQGGLIGSKIARKLRDMGFKAVVTPDFMGIGSAIASPRSFIEDLYCNRFAAVSSGLAFLAESGRAVTKEFGTRQRFIAILTDAELAENPLIEKEPELCAECEKFCIKKCPTMAMSSEKIGFECEGVNFSFNKRDINRCDWSKRYALTAESGFKYSGSLLDEMPEENISVASLAEALKKHDPIKKYRPMACEPCVIKCPYSLK
jgi:epoxyqueuosine reductase QueG